MNYHIFCFILLILYISIVSYAEVTEKFDLKNIQKELGLEEEIDLNTLLYILSQNKINQEKDGEKNEEIKSNSNKESDEFNEDIIDFDTIDYDDDIKKFKLFTDSHNQSFDYIVDLEEQNDSYESEEQEINTQDLNIAPPTLFTPQNNVILEEVKSVLSKDFSFLKSISQISTTSNSLKAITSFSKALANKSLKLRKIMIDILNNFHPKLRQLYMNISDFVSQKLNKKY